MPYKNPEERRAYRKKWYAENRNKEIEGAKLRKKDLQQRNRDFVNQHKVQSKCKICGESEVVCLDLHHRDNESKIDDISTMVNRPTSLEAIQQEIEKCDVLCANCHRKLHAGLLNE